ncbi:hypothetical protein SAMN05192544_104715 [Paraburkholderia hospita]|jgi:branched-subunit amino acid ABC-type transport system permease component|nr:hypothetical protein SAMN05192544_104715 [Paraburkholderia hospita]
MLGQMKLLRIFLGAVLGAVGATVVAWGGLYLFGMVRGSGSLFDTNPEAANRFFALWFAIVLLASIAGGVRASRR